MKTILLQTMLAFLLMGTAFSQQIETFEGETHGATSFNMGGLNFTITGDLMIEVITDFGCDQGDAYLGSGTTNGGSIESFGSIKVTHPGDTFSIPTSSSWCAVTSSNDGVTAQPGDIKFIGTLSTGGTIEETISVVPEPPYGWIDISFSSDIWEGQELTELEASIASNFNYMALDNIVLGITVPVSNIQEEEIKIYPNPTMGEIEIIGIDDVEVKVVDAFGRVVKEQTVYNQKIDVSNLPVGVYYISINTHNQQIIKGVIKL